MIKSSSNINNKAKIVPSSLANAALFIVLVGLFSKGLGFIREILFANFFGVGQNFDLYLVAAALPLVINTVILNTIQNYFIPSYHKVKLNSPDQLNFFFSSSFWFFTISGFLVSLIIFFLTPGILSLYLPDLSEADHSNIVLIFNLFLITIPLSAGTSVLISYLQAEYKFNVPAVSQFIMNILFIVLLVAAAGTVGILAIPIAYILGLLTQLIYLIKYCPPLTHLGFFKLDFISLIKNNRGALLYIIIIEAVGQLYLLSDRYFFYLVEPGGISALNYAYSLFLLPISVMSFALTTVLFPHFSETLNNNDKTEFNRSFTEGLKITLLIFVPISFLFIHDGQAIVQLLFERGHFNSTATGLTFSVLKIYSFILPFYAVYAILNKAIYSIKKIKYLLYLTLLGMLIKIIFNYLFVGKYQQEGLAASTVLSYFIFFLGSIFILIKYIGKEQFLQMIKIMFIIFTCALLSLLLADLLGEISGQISFLKEMLHLFIFIILYYITLLIIGRNLLDSIHKLFIDLMRKFFIVA